MRWNLLTRQIIPLLVAAIMMTSSVMRLEKPLDKARLFTAGIEYDYIAWTLGAVNEKTGQAQVNGIDGVRVDWEDGFGLIRASNTTPVLVLRFEGHTPEALERIQHAMLELLRRVKPDAVLGAAAH